MAAYIGLIHKDPNSDYGISFPDFPGCISAGSSIDEARQNAEEALAFHIEGMSEDGEGLPEPTPLDAIMSSDESRNAVAVLINVPMPEPRSVRVNITLPEDLLKRVDTAAHRAGYTRSGFLAAAAKREIGRLSNNDN